MDSYWHDEFMWFIGIVDGEGCFNITKIKRGGYNAMFAITNTNVDIVGRCQRLLQILKIPYKMVRYCEPGCKPGERVVIQGYEILKPFLELILPHITRFSQCDLLLQFVKLRLREGDKYRTEITDEEESIYVILKQENKRGV